MLANLYAVAAARAVDQELAVDVDGNMMYLHPPFAASRAATSVVGTVARTTGSVLASEEDKVACLKLRRVCEQHVHIAALLRHACGG